jgi:hypothetical protein
LLYMLVAKPTRAANHALVMLGMVGWRMAMPMPRARLAPKSPAVPPSPRAPDETPTTTSPTTRVKRGPRRATAAEPTTAASARTRMGRLVKAAIAVSLRWSSCWMSGRTGGSARTVIRRLAPMNHSSPSR